MLTEPEQGMAAHPQADAIVVLTGPDDWQLARRRLVVAAGIQIGKGIPLMLCGKGSSGVEMRLGSQFSAEVRWLEDTSTTTYENGTTCGRLLRQSHVKRIILVTDEYHMRRAAVVFRWQGLSVAPAVSSRLDQEPYLGRAGGGSTEAWLRIRTAMHELFGHVWYRARRIVET